MKISQIAYHPLKSGPIITTETHYMLQGGLEYDRSLMLVDAETGDFISLRDNFSAPLTQLRAVTSNALKLGESDINLNPDLQKETMAVTYRGETLEVYNMGDVLADTFSDILNHKVRLVKAMPGKGFSVDGNPENKKRNNGFSDGYPLLITNQASLDYLQPHFEADNNITMSRFRPNIVVQGAEPFEEDSWKVIEINGVRYDLEKPCQRCIVTTKSPETGEKDSKSEPIRTLNKLRRGFSIEADGRKKPKVFFGMNATPKLPVNSREPISVGMTIKVLEKYDPVHALVSETKIRHGRLSL